jgi:hypothetical protein
VLTVNDWLTSSGKYPWRAKHKEVTPELIERAMDYVTRLNAACKELYIKEPKFSSGFRPAEVNKKLVDDPKVHASKKSQHMTGTAGDLADPEGKIDHEFLMNQHILEKHGLYLEHPKHTEGWAHTQSVAPRSGNRVFIP